MATQRQSPREAEAPLTGEALTLSQLDEDFGPATIDKDGKPIGGLALTERDGRWSIGNSRDIANEYFAFIDNKGDYKFGTIEAIRKDYIDQAKKDKGGIEGFRKRLLDAGYIDEGEYQTKDSTALNTAIANLGRSVAQDIYSAWETRSAWTTPISRYLTSKSVGVERTPRATQVETSRQDANQDINTFFMETVGFRPTQAQRDEYYRRLREAEKKAFRKGKVQGGVEIVQDTLLDEEDIFNIRAEILMPVVKDTPLEKITVGGGRIAQNVNQLKQYASQYGINLSTQDALNRVTGQLKKGALRDLSQQETQIREMSKAFYTNISDLIDKGVTVEDIGKQFASTKAKLLDVPEASISIFDKDIQDAIRNIGEDGTSKGAGVMSNDMFQQKVRKDPRWAQTADAKNQAYAYVNAITRMFGLTT